METLYMYLTGNQINLGHNIVSQKPNDLRENERKSLNVREYRRGKQIWTIQRKKNTTQCASDTTIPKRGVV